MLIGIPIEFQHKLEVLVFLNCPFKYFLSFWPSENFIFSKSKN